MTERLVEVPVKSTLDKLNEVTTQLPLNRALGLLFQHVMLMLSLALKATGVGWALVIAARLVGLADLCVAVRQSFCLVEAPGSIASTILSAQGCVTQPGDRMQIMAFISDLLIAISDVMDVVMLLSMLGLFSLGGAAVLLPMIGYAALALGGGLLCAKALAEIPELASAKGLQLQWVEQNRRREIGKALLAALLAIAAACTAASLAFSPVGVILSAVALTALLALCTLRMIAHFSDTKPQILVVPVEEGQDPAWHKGHASAVEAVAEICQEQVQQRSVKGICGGVTLTGYALQACDVQVVAKSVLDASSDVSDAIVEFRLPEAILKVCANPQKHDQWINLTKVTAQSCKTLSRFKVIEIAKGALRYVGWISCTAELYLAAYELWSATQSKPPARAPVGSHELAQRIKPWKISAASARIMLAITAVVTLFFGHLALAIVAAAGVLAMTISRVTATLMERSSVWRLKPLTILASAPALEPGQA